jgi:hypothetical protein
MKSQARFGFASVLALKQTGEQSNPRHISPGRRGSLSRIEEHTIEAIH